MSAPVSPVAGDFWACVGEEPVVLATGRGLVEYAERGSGPPLLSLHGSPAAFENGLLIAEFARVNGFRVVAPSRPGYGGTPLGIGRTPAEQADGLAALLDSLELDRVAVLAMSGGGPAGYALAGVHPDRVSRLLQVESIALPTRPPRIGRIGLRLPALARLGAWMIDRFPSRVLATMGAPPTTDHDLQAAQVAIARGIVTTATGWKRLGAGYDNDAAQFADLPPLPFSSITCPTLVVHGTADTRVPIAHAEHAHTAIAGSELRRVEGGGHTAFLFRPDLQQEAATWLQNHQDR
jgi:pimeloyl-ACP methyl ester carboxylesterase